MFDQAESLDNVSSPFAPKPTSLDQLLALSSDDLSKVDIARVNLLCATGLPGAKHLDAPGIESALAILDRWAEHVRVETERHLHRLKDARYAAHYRYSEAFFRAEFLLQVLQQDLGIRYDLNAADNFSFRDSRVAFLHGMIPPPPEAAPAPEGSMADVPGGTCVSIPVMYVSIGRRLGYPLCLVTTKAHTRRTERYLQQRSNQGFRL